MGNLTFGTYRTVPGNILSKRFTELSEKKKRPWNKWFTILDRLEGELKKEFPPNPDHNPRVHGRVPADIGGQLSREIMAIRSTLRNLEKAEGK